MAHLRTVGGKCKYLTFKPLQFHVFNHVLSGLLKTRLFDKIRQNFIQFGKIVLKFY